LTEGGSSLFREGIAHDEPVSLANQETFGNHLRRYAGKASSGILLIYVACLTKRQREVGVERL
jgi:hypothetical protein